MEDPAFLGHFWQLGVEDPSTRASAVNSLLHSLRVPDNEDCRGESPAVTTVGDVGGLRSTLSGELRVEPLDKAGNQEIVQCHPIQEGKCKNDVFGGKDFQFKLPLSKKTQNPAIHNALEYTINRLLHGLCSGRGGVRQGYAAALTAILVSSPETVPLSLIVDAVHSITTCRRRTALGEIKVIQQTGYFKSTSCVKRIGIIVEDLLESLDAKSYLQDAVASVLASIIIDVESHSPAASLNIIAPRFSELFDASTSKWLNTSWPALCDTKKPAKSAKSCAPFGLLSLYLKLHQHLLPLLPSRITDPSSSMLDSSPYSSWRSFSRNPLDHSDMRRIVVLILSHQSTVTQLHPKIANAWNDVFSLLVHSQNQSHRLKRFREVLQMIEYSFFSSHPSSSPDDKPVAMSLQKVFCGFRIMIQLLATLKVESLRCPHDNVPWMLVHIDFPATPLHQAALKCIGVLSEIAQGVHPSRSQQGECNQSRSHRKHGGEINDLDVVSVGVYSLSNVSLISVPETGVNKGGGPTTGIEPGSPLYSLYMSPIRVSNHAWIQAAEAFGEASKFSLIHSGFLPRLTNLFFRSLSADGYSLLFDSLFKSPLSLQWQNPVEKYLWNFDVVSHLVFFPPQVENMTTSPLLVSAALVAVQTAATTLVSIHPKTIGQSLKVVGVPFCGTNVEAVPLLVDHGDRGSVTTQNRMLSRLGRCLSHLFGHLIHQVDKVLTTICCASGGTSERHYKHRDALSGLASRFALDFIGTLITGLSQVLLPGRKKQFASLEDVINFFSCIKDRESEKATAPKHFRAVDEAGKKVSIILHSTHHLSERDIQLLLMFGAMSSHIISIIAKTIVVHSEEEILDSEDSLQLSIVLETLISIISLTSLLFVPLFVARRSAFAADGDVGSDLNSFKLDSPTNGGNAARDVFPRWRDENAAECRAALELMEQIGTSCYLDVIVALKMEATGRASIEAINSGKLSEVLRAVSDVIPGIILSPVPWNDIPNKNQAPFMSQHGAAQTELLVAQGLVSSVLLSLWKSTAKYASVETIDHLIIETFNNDNENGRHFEEEEKEEDNRSRDGSDNETGFREGAVVVEEVGEAEERTKVMVTTTRDTTTDGNVSTSDESSDEEDDGSIHERNEEIDDSKLWGMLLDESSTHETTHSKDHDGATYQFNRTLREKKLRQHQHLQRIKVQAKFTRLEIIQSSLDQKLVRLATLTSEESLGKEATSKCIKNPGTKIIQQTLQQVKWISILADALRRLVLKQSRKLSKMNGKRGAKKRDLLSLEEGFSEKVKQVVSRQCTKLIALLGQPKVLAHQGDEKINEEVIMEALRFLRDVGFSLTRGFAGCTSGFSKEFSARMVKSEEAGSLFFLCLGKLEEKLLMLCGENPAAFEKLAELGDSSKFNIVGHLSSQETDILKTQAMEETIDIKDASPSSYLVTTSGLILTDILTTLIVAWTKKSHTQITERFFRSLLSQASHYFSSDPPLGLIGTPFSLGTINASKLFVCRELLAVDSQFRLLCLKSTTLSTTRLIDTAIGRRIAKHLLEWNFNLLEVSGQCKLSVHLPLWLEFKDEILGSAYPEDSLVIHHSLLGWEWGIRALQALADNRTLASKSTRGGTDVAEIHLDDSNPNKGDNMECQENIERTIVSSGSKKGEKWSPFPNLQSDLTRALPYSKQLGTMKRTAKVTFEQQVVAALHRYGRRFEVILEQAKFSPKLLEELKVLVNRSKRVMAIKVKKRRKREREEG